jgi:protein involved in polysaccharide export with SLBB domain
MSTTAHLGRVLPLLLALFATLGTSALSSCTTSPDKRVLQYLNQEGYGKRYVGNIREEAYITIGDLISVYDEFDDGWTADAEVEVDGTVFLPQLGSVPVAGMTRSELESYLTQRRSELFVRTSVKVRRMQLGPRYYWILGEVTSGGGRKALTEDLTIFDAVMLARPDATRANAGRIRLIRADPVDPLILHFDLRDMLAGTTGDSSRNYEIRENDIIVVPPTFMTQLGNFIAALVTPIGQVLNGLLGPLLQFARYERISDGTNFVGF